jgi:hypothetical protein
MARIFENAEYKLIFRSPTARSQFTLYNIFKLNIISKVKLT